MTNSIIINNENTRDRTRKVLNSTNKTLVLISISKRIKEKKSSSFYIHRHRTRK